MRPLNTTLRNQLERTVIAARDAAQVGAAAALERLAVDKPDPFGNMTAEQRALRVQLRAKGRQLGDERKPNGEQDIWHLHRECAYEVWHQMLFARFLAENHLLMHPDGVPVTLDECEELAKDEGTDGWTLAGRYASKMLPQVFRADDPVLKVTFAPEDKQALEALLAALPCGVFTADDSLGWCYQFWQSEEKKRVNAAGNKIGADELPAVTQLFTEDYMVDFLLDNTLGAWHAGIVLAANPRLAENAQSEDELRQAMALPGCPWKYLRFIKGDTSPRPPRPSPRSGAGEQKWTPAAGTFDGWPKTAKELKCLDPCMGSGHFVVAMFERLVALRLAEETLDEAAAVAAVIRDNLFGLEIDPRCTQIGAFNLALAAWRRVGHRPLPAMNLACSGLAPNAREADWLAIAGDNEKLQNGMERLYGLFQKAAVLGSLINPRAGEGDLLVAAFHELQPLLEQALAQETQDDTAHEMAVTARGLAKAAEILAGQFTLVATNVPFLGRPEQTEPLRDYCDRFHTDARQDLATCFVERCLSFLHDKASAALVTPQSWFNQPAYTSLRERLLASNVFPLVGRLGPRAFETISGERVNVCVSVISNLKPLERTEMAAIRADEPKTPSEKAVLLQTGAVVLIAQIEHLKRPDSVVVFEQLADSSYLSEFAFTAQGFATSDNPPFIRMFWEFPQVQDGWVFAMSAPSSFAEFGGRSELLLWQDGEGAYYRHAMALKREGRLRGWKSGAEAWGRRGVLVSEMGRMASTIYSGEMFDHTAHALVPKREEFLRPIWAYVSSSEFRETIRKISQKLNITNETLVKVPFDLAHWQKVAAEKYLHGLPKPFSSDPTQWLFNGNPAGADQPLHVAVARLLGYQWPRQTGSSFPDCPTLAPDGLEELADHDGIVCIPAVSGEQPGTDRLLTLLAACGIKPDRNLDEWLRDSFFEEHFRPFHHRPFVWHIWDGRKKDGFHALVNYHKLDRKLLEKLIYTYLGDWINRQKAAEQRGESGAEARRFAAEDLQSRLKLILAGEPPYDIFVRWKPIEQQAIGWDPDLNDGVRMNIRPFVEAGVLRKNPNIKWTKDRGKEPERSKAQYPWFWGWDETTADFTGGDQFDGSRWNDCHYANKIKQAAREAAQRDTIGRSERSSR